METKKVKLSKKKNGKGYVTSYTVNLGPAEVRSLGIDLDGDVYFTKIIDEENHQIILKPCD